MGIQSHCIGINSNSHNYLSYLLNIFIMTNNITLICEVFCHQFYVAAMYLLGAFFAFHGLTPWPLWILWDNFASQMEVAVPIYISGFLKPWPSGNLNYISKRPPSFQDSLSLQHPPWIPDSRCVFLKRLLQKRRLRISHPSPWATSVSTGAAQHGGCIPLWRISSPAGFIHDPGWKTRHHQTHLRGQVSFFRT